MQRHALCAYNTYVQAMQVLQQQARSAADWSGLSLPYFWHPWRPVAHAGLLNLHGDADHGRRTSQCSANSVVEMALRIVNGGGTKITTHLAKIYVTLSSIDEMLPRILEYMKENQEDVSA